MSRSWFEINEQEVGFTVLALFSPLRTNVFYRPHAKACGANSKKQVCGLSAVFHDERRVDQQIDQDLIMINNFAILVCVVFVNAQPDEERQNR